MPPPVRRPAKAPSARPAWRARARSLLTRQWLWAVVVCLVGVYSVFAAMRASRLAPASYAAGRSTGAALAPDGIWAEPAAMPPTATAAPPAKPPYARDRLAPNGAPWPARAEYLAGYAVKSRTGAAHLTIDNTRADGDIHAKLVMAGSNPPDVQREVFVPAHGSFSFDKLAPGQYDIRYRDLDSGKCYASGVFDTEEMRSRLGSNPPSASTLTLRRTSKRDSEVHEIAEEQFVGR